MLHDELSYELNIKDQRSIGIPSFNIFYGSILYFSILFVELIKYKELIVSAKRIKI